MRFIFKAKAKQWENNGKYTQTENAQLQPAKDHIFFRYYVVILDSKIF